MSANLKVIAERREDRQGLIAATPAQKTVTPTLLAPSAIEKMLKERETFQRIKFRTTCSDCVPNL